MVFCGYPNDTALTRGAFLHACGSSEWSKMKGDFVKHFWLGLFSVFAASAAFFVALGASELQASPVDLLEMPTTGIGAAPGNYATGAGITVVNPSSGVWNGSYTSLSTAGITNDFFVASNPNGGVDAYNFVGGVGYGKYPQVWAGTYTAIDSDPGMDYLWFGARPASAGGGVDAFYPYAGQYVTDHDWTGTTYVGLAAHGTASLSGLPQHMDMAAIKPAGGVDLLYYAPGSGYVTYTPANVAGHSNWWSGTYVSITADPAQAYRYYAAKPGGGVDLLTFDGTNFNTTSPAGWSGTYIDVEAMDTNASTTTDILAGVKAGGGVDVLYYSAATGYVTYSNVWSGKYSYITSDPQYTDAYYAIPAPVPEPSMLVLLAAGLFGMLCYAWRKRK